MDIRKQIKDLDVDISNRNAQLEELQYEVKNGKRGVSVLTKDILVSRDTNKTKRNNHVLILDDKEWNRDIFFRNLNEDSSNYIVMDIDGEIYHRTAKDFERRGYQIKRVDLMDIASSEGYNPFVYIRNEEEVEMIVQCIVQNTTSDYYLKTPGKDRVSIKNLEQNFLVILLSCYMKYGNVKSFAAAVNLLRGEERDKKLDQLFSGQFPQGPNEMECRRFHLFKEQAKDRYSDILDSCCQRIFLFREDKLVQLQRGDTLELDAFYQGSQVLYLILPSAMRQMELLTSIFFSQILYLLCCEKRQYNQDRDIILYLNHFVESGVIPYLDKYMENMRDCRMGCMIHADNLNRISQMYSKWEELFGYCDTVLYLGSNDAVMQKFLLDMADTTMVRRKKVVGKEVFVTSAIKQEEINDMEKNDCICVIKGIGTFLSARLVTDTKLL